MLERPTLTAAPPATLTSGLGPVTAVSESLPVVVPAPTPKLPPSDYARAFKDFAFLALPVPATALVFAGAAAACGVHYRGDLLAAMLFSLPVGGLGSFLLAKCLHRVRSETPPPALEAKTD